MQYFSIVSRKGDAPPKTCAMIQDSTLAAAAKKARIFIDSDHLPHVDRSDKFSIRKSSRRETSLLQSFLASTTNDQMSTYLQEDVESLLFRRNSMLLSFFAALYLAPEAVKARYAPNGATRAESRPSPAGCGGGSGGVTMDPDASWAEAGGKEVETQEAENIVDDGAVGSDNQIDALDDIINGGGEDIAGNDEIELF